jgi:chorismate-pyruvate lyase
MHLSCDFDLVEPSLRVLLTSDGTVTDMLQTICRERINARKITQELQSAVCSIQPLELAPGESVLRRRVLLHGNRTGTNYVYADSWIAIDRLDARFREGLLKSDTPIGRLWRNNRVEIFKEIIGVSEAAAGHIAGYFGTSADTNLLVRTCRVFVLGRPAMLITEHFSPALAVSTTLHFPPKTPKNPCTRMQSLNEVGQAFSPMSLSFSRLF